MAVLLGAIVIGLLPFAVVVALLVLVGRRRRMRDENIAYQVALTDAIHRELGAVVAPSVTRRREVVVAVPLDRPGLLEAVVAIADRTVRRRASTSEGWRFVFTPRPVATPARMADEL